MTIHKKARAWWERKINFSGCGRRLCWHEHGAYTYTYTCIYTRHSIYKCRTSIIHDIHDFGWKPPRTRTRKTLLRPLFSSIDSSREHGLEEQSCFFYSLYSTSYWWSVEQRRLLPFIFPTKREGLKCTIWQRKTRSKRKRTVRVFNYNSFN